MEKKMVDINNLYGDNFKELKGLMKNYTKEQLALIVMKQEEEIWDLFEKVEYLGEILNDEDKWDNIDEFHNFLKSEVYNLIKKTKESEKK